MRIIVDKMPKEKKECPYCVEKTTKELEIPGGWHDAKCLCCGWQDAEHSCYGPEECPYFVAFSRIKADEEVLYTG